MTIKDLASIAQANGLILRNDQLLLLSKYADLLRKKNSVVNLLSRKDEENIFSKHILHSLSLIIPTIPLAGISSDANVFDLGTGGGLPGIPLRISNPQISVTFCDSIGKKIVAVSEFIESLELTNCRAFAERSEALATKPLHRKKYDIVVSRAVAPLDQLVFWSFGLLKRGGILFALKGGDISEELARTSQMKGIAKIEECPLGLQGFDGFVIDEKKMIRVTLNS